MNLIKIKMMYKILLIALFGLILTSCSPKLTPVAGATKDSVFVKEHTIYTHDTVTTVGETVELIKFIKCPDAKFDTVIKKGNTTITASLKNGSLSMQCKSDSLTHIIDSITTLKQKEFYHTETITVNVEVVKYKVPKWCWWLLLGVFCYVAYCFKNPIVFFIKSFIK